MPDLLPKLHDRFPAIVAWIQVPPAVAVVLFFGVEHVYYRLFPALLLLGGTLFLLPIFASGRLRFVPPLFYFGLISLLSATSTRTSRPVTGFVFHPAEFFFLALLWAWALSRSPRSTPVRTVVTVLGLCAVAGALDEWHQSFVPGRVADPLDGLLDLSGAVAGCAFFYVLPRSVRTPASPKTGGPERIPA